MDCKFGIQYIKKCRLKNKNNYTIARHIYYCTHCYMDKIFNDCIE